MPAELVCALGAIPSYYLRYYYQTARVVEEQRSGHTRAQDVIDIEARLLDLYRDETLTEKPALLADRGGAFYSEAAAQLIASLHDGAGDLQVVDVRNDGALPDLPDSAVVEIPARIDRDGAHPIALEPLAPEMRGLVQAAKAYEELAVAAAISGDRRTALRAMIANPLVGWEVAEPLLDALLEANRPYLPRFFALTVGRSVRFPASRSTTGASSSTSPSMNELIPRRARRSRILSTSASTEPMNRCGDSRTSSTVSSMPVRARRWSMTRCGLGAGVVGHDDLPARRVDVELEPIEPVTGRLADPADLLLGRRRRSGCAARPADRTAGAARDRRCRPRERPGSASAGRLRRSAAAGVAAGRASAGRRGR